MDFFSASTKGENKETDGLLICRLDGKRKGEARVAILFKTAGISGGRNHRRDERSKEAKGISTGRERKGLLCVFPQNEEKRKEKSG